MNKVEIEQFIESQKSLHLYKNIRDALRDVLGRLSIEQFEKIKNNLIIMAFDDGVKGQVMHFPPQKDNFAVMQLYIEKTMPNEVLRWVIAHEIGHVLQGRNWIESDGLNLENGADNFAKDIGYIKTESITKWLKDNGTTKLQ